MFLTAERKFQKLNRNPDCVTDPHLNLEWWDALELVYRAERTVWRLFVEPQPTRLVKPGSVKGKIYCRASIRRVMVRFSSLSERRSSSILLIECSTVV